MAETTSYEKTIGNRQNEQKLTLIETLKEMPIVQVACKKAGVSRGTYYRWRAEDENFLQESNEAMKEGAELICDMSESQLIQLIREKKLPAIALWLKHHHPKYTERIEIPSRFPLPEKLSPEQEAVVAEALHLASFGMEQKDDQNRSDD